ncbi:hypothetical protein Tco_1447906 [Tanacetum coccineum]
MELVGFSEEQLIPVGKVELEVACGSEGLYRRTMKFTTKQVEQKGKAEEVEPDRQKEPAEEEILINPAFPKQKVTIKTQFSKECRLQLINLLKNNMDVFAWKPSNMTGVPKCIIKHTLNVNTSTPPVAQKRGVLGT